MEIAFLAFMAIMLAGMLLAFVMIVIDTVKMKRLAKQMLARFQQEDRVIEWAATQRSDNPGTVYRITGGSGIPIRYWWAPKLIDAKGQEIDNFDGQIPILDQHTAAWNHRRSKCRVETIRILSQTFEN